MLVHCAVSCRESQARSANVPLPAATLSNTGEVKGEEEIRLAYLLLFFPLGRLFCVMQS